MEKKGRDIYDSPDQVGPCVPAWQGRINSHDRKVKVEPISGQQFHEIAKPRTQYHIYRLGTPALPYAPIDKLPEEGTLSIPHSRHIHQLSRGDTLTHADYISLSGTIIAHAVIFDDIEHIIEIDTHVGVTEVLHAHNVGLSDDAQPVLYDFHPGHEPWNIEFDAHHLIYTLNKLEQSHPCDLSSISFQDALKKVERLLEFYLKPEGADYFAGVAKTAHTFGTPRSEEDRYRIFLHNIKAAIELLHNRIVIAEGQK